MTNVYAQSASRTALSGTESKFLAVEMGFRNEVKKPLAVKV